MICNQSLVYLVESVQHRTGVLQQTSSYKCVINCFLVVSYNETVIVFNCLILSYISSVMITVCHTGRPKYLTYLLQLHKPTRSTCSPYTQLLTVPRHNLSFRSCTFRISAPKNWNTLPLEVRQSHSSSTFRNRLKTFCFRSTYPSS